MPTVSVIIPVYNGEAFLDQCIESIINQSMTPHQILIIDDGSTDGSKEIAQGYSNIEYVHQKNLGVASARNLGLSMATGEFVAFIDQDDFWNKEALAQRLSYVEAHNDARVVLGKQYWFLDGLKEKPSWVKSEQMDHDLNGFLMGCALLKKDLFDEFGIFDTSFRFCSDFDWFFRLKDGGVAFHQIEQTILNKRIHAKNESRHANLSLKELSKAVFYSIRRKNSNEEK